MQRHLWTAVAAGTCAAVSNSDTAQQKDSSTQKVRERPLWIRVLAIVCFAFILIGAISNLLKRVPHVSKEPSGTRLNENNAAEYAPDIGLPQAENIEYTIDVHEKVFHIAGCSLVNQIKDTDRMLATVSRDEIIAKGYTPCEECHP